MHFKQVKYISYMQNMHINIYTIETNINDKDLNVEISNLLK